MTKNEIVSHNLQLVMDALSEDEYQKFMVNYIEIGNFNVFSRLICENSKWSLCYAFFWRNSNEGYDFWQRIFDRD